MREDIYLDASNWFFGTPTYIIDGIFNENNFSMFKNEIIFFNIEEKDLKKILCLLYKYRDKGR